MARIVGLVLLLWLLMQTGAHADTAYLRDGQTIWGKDIYEEGDQIVIVRPSGPVRVPRAQVLRIDRLRTTLPRLYSPPAPAVVEAPGGTSPAPPPAPAPVATPRQPTAPAPGTPVPAAAPSAPSQPTALPSPPPPPSQQ
ncbi:MAG: hypothetical protein ACE147_13565 [Candidatus Methylomirabilales bacterium]